MNARGHYNRPPRNQRSASGAPVIGAQLRHMLELRQRYDNVATDAMQALLNSLTKKATGRPISSTQWEFELRDETAWVITTWFSEIKSLEITITDKKSHSANEVASTQARYEQILSRDVDPPLQQFGATMIGRALRGAPLPGPYHRRDLQDSSRYRRGHGSYYRSNMIGAGTPADVTQAQTHAMASLNRTPILGIPARDWARDKLSPLERRYLENSANARLTDICNKLAPQRPGSVQMNGWYPLRQFAPTPSDVAELATRFLAAVSAGVEAGQSTSGGPLGWTTDGYRVSRDQGVAQNKNVMRNILAGDFSTEAGFSKLGEACVEVMRCKEIATDEIPFDQMLERAAAWVSTRRRSMQALGDLVIEMDDQGLRLEKPAEDPTVWGGIQHAARETADWALGIPSDVADVVKKIPKVALIGGAVALGALGIYALAKKSRN